MDQDEAMQNLAAKLNSLRARRNVMLVRHQITSVLDAELSALEVEFRFLPGVQPQMAFERAHAKLDERIEQTARTWFH